MLNILLFVLFAWLLIFFGSILSRKYLPESFGTYAKLPINFLLGLSVHLIIAHSLAYFIHSYRLSAIISEVLMLLALAFTMSKKQFCIKSFFASFDRKDWCLLLGTLVIAIWCGLRGHWTDSDNTHIAWMRTIVSNDIYPPYIPVEKGYSLTFYHYGIDLIGSSICSVTGLMSWDTISFQVGIGCFLVISSIFAFTSLFVKSFANRLWATLIIAFCTSVTAIEFFYKFIGKISQIGVYDFLHHWQNAALTSVCDVPYYLVLISQSMGLSSILALLIIVYLAEKQAWKNNSWLYLGITLCSFVGYFCYSSFWYPAFIGLLMYFGIKFLANFKIEANKDTIINLALIVISFFLGKVFTWQFSSTSFSGVQALVFEPSLYWDHYAMNFLGYFDFNIDGLGVKPATDYNSGKTVFQVHLFTLTTLRNFGYYAIIALALLVYRAVKKSLDFSSVLLLSAIPAIAVAFLFRFVPKYTEMYRFPSFGVVCITLFVVISIFFLMEREENNFVKILLANKIIQVILVFHLLLLTAPGVVATLPGFSYNRFSSDELLDKQEKNLLKVLMKYQKTGDVVLTNKIFYTFCDFSSVAGFYGIGGQMYKPDWQTRSTAVYLLNPILLRELGVNYVLIYKDDKLSDIAKQRLQDPSLFREEIEINQVHSDYRFYRFLNAKQYTQKEIAQLQREYKWVIGTKLGQNFNQLMHQGKPVEAATKQELQLILENFRKEIAKNNIPAAVWLSAQAIQQARH